MTTDGRDAGTRADLAFFGRVTAGLSHEINNVLAVVNELAGLVADLAAADRDDRPLDPARVGNLARRVAARVEDGKGLVKQLNRFAHAVDEPRVRLDARDALRQAAGLAARVARMAKVELKTELPDADTPLEAGPFDLQRLLFLAMEAAVARARPGTAVAVSLEAPGAGVVVRLAGVARTEPDPRAPERLAAARRLAEDLGGNLQGAPDSGDTFSLAIRLPAVLRAPAGESAPRTGEEE